jgi:hypothetical protein
MIPKPQYPYTARLEAARALLIAGAPWRGVVLASVDLNRQSHCGAIEIQHKTCDGVLPAKAETVELFTTEALPQALLRVGHVLAQVTRGLQEGRGGTGVGFQACFSPLSACLAPLRGRSALRASPRWGEVSEIAFSKALMASLICNGVTPVYPATLWRPGDQRCQSPR